MEDRGDCAAAHRVAKSWTRFGDWQQPVTLTCMGVWERLAERFMSFGWLLGRRMCLHACTYLCVHSCSLIICYVQSSGEALIHHTGPELLVTYATFTDKRLLSCSFLCLVFSPQIFTKSHLLPQSSFLSTPSRTACPCIPDTALLFFMGRKSTWINSMLIYFLYNTKSNN